MLAFVKVALKLDVFILDFTADAFSLVLMVQLSLVQGEIILNLLEV